MDVGKRQRPRSVRILRGAAVAGALLVGGVFALLGSAGALTELPVLRATVQLSGSPLAVHAPVQYRGVVVGKLESVTPISTGGTTSRIEMRLQPDQLARIPASVRLRILPRTVFGDQFLDLVGTGHRSAGSLHGGQTIQPDRSAGTVDLYDSYQRAYRLITRLRPAQLNEVLGQLSTLLGGKGEDIGRLIDRADRASGKLMPLSRKIAPVMREIAHTTSKLRQAAPDLYAALGDAVHLSKFVTAHQRQIATMLTGGAAGSQSAKRLLARNQGNIITLLHTGNPVGSAFATHQDGLNDILLSLANLGNATDGVSHKTTIHLNTLDLHDSAPYTSKDCPHYGNLDGPNCSMQAPQPRSGKQNGPPRQAPAGNVGSAGSADEVGKLRSMLPALTGTRRQPPKTADGAIDMFLGPIFRGTTVVTR